MNPAVYKQLNLLALLTMALALTACGTGSVNQGAPSGTLVATGTLSGVGSVTASASLSLYSQGNGAYAVQIANLTYSGSSCSFGTSVSVLSSGSYASGSALQGSGAGSSFNYSFSNLSAQPSQIVLYCTGGSPVSSYIQASSGTLNPA